MAKYFKLAWKGDFTADLVRAHNVDESLIRASAIGDFNSDGIEDLLLPIFELNVGQPRTGPTPGRFMLLTGLGDGSFQDQTWRLPNGGVMNTNVRFSATGDFNNDGVTDFVVSSNYEDGRPINDPVEMAVEQVAYVSDHGSFKRVELGLKTWGHALTVGDWNGDGLDDIVVGGLSDDTNGSHTVVVTQGTGGQLTPQSLTDTRGLSYALADLDGDGRDEFVDFYTRYDEDGLQGSGLKVSFIDSSGDIFEEQYLEQPFVRVEIGNAWNIDGIPFLIKLDNKGHEYVDEGIHQLRSADFDNDGRADIIGVRFGFEKYYVNGVLTQLGAQSLSQLELYTLGDNGLQRMSGGISGWENPKYGVYDFKIVDWNFDGHEDLFVYMGYNKKDCVHIFLNDGEANFQRIPQKYIPNGKYDYKETAEPIDANRDGIMDLYYRIEDFQTAFDELPKKSDAVYLGTRPFFTGPNFSDPAKKGAPGFNEAYYLNANPDVAALVKSGKFSTGLEHYLDVGRDEGRPGFAIGTHVVGSKRNDLILLREGSETAQGKGGNDWIDGQDGADVLSGGKGRDKFVYFAVEDSAAGNSDRIVDFVTGQDVIDLHHVDASSVASGNNEFQFLQTGGAAFSGTPGQLRWYAASTTQGKMTMVDGDMNGDRAADFAIVLNGTISLQVDDFIL